MTHPDPAALRALASEWLDLDLQASMTEAEMARYDKLPLLMAQALHAIANWRESLEIEVAGDIEATREQVLAAIDAGADQADILRLNRVVWRLFDRATALRLTFRRLDHASATVAARDALLGRARQALTPFARTGELFGERDPDSFDQAIYTPAAGDEYSLCGDDLRAARALAADIDRLMEPKP
jgi:hypothetical protein